MTTSSGTIGLDIAAGVATLELRRPAKHNSLTSEMLRTITSLAREVAASPDVPVMVLRGQGASFCAGADLGTVRDASGVPSETVHAEFAQALEAIRAVPFPTVASIKGACIGGGCALALACDIRFADGSALFSVPAARYGIVYEASSVRRLVEIMGTGQTSRFLFGAGRVDVDEALRLGLVDQRADDVDALVADFSHDVLRGDAATVRATKRLVFGA